MKKIIENQNNLVIDSLQGLVAYNHDLKLLVDTKVIINKNYDPNLVAIISGGGSGHEPAHSGFVGSGMLSAAVNGEIFTSPSPDQIIAAVKELNPQKGTLLIVKNYTGDILNFEIAASLLAEEGFVTKTVVVNDDVAVQNSSYTIGRRGIAGTLFVHKIAGALAQSKASLDEVFEMAQKVINNLRSIGVSFGGVINPSTALKSFSLAEDEIEFGLGIHGEPGIEKIKMLPIRQLISKMLDKILNDYDFQNAPLALLVNGLGGTTLLELNIALKITLEILKTKNYEIASLHLGSYMTSLEMPGFSLTLLKLDAPMLALLKAPVVGTLWK